MERSLEQGEELLLVGVAFMVETETEVVEFVPHQEAAEKTVPQGEHAAIVGVVLASEPRVMQAVHHGGGDDEAGQTIQGGGNGDVAVVELNDWGHEERVEQQVFDACTHQHEEWETQQFRKQYLQEMEAPTGGDIKGGVAVVYGVESPEKCRFMVESMPDVHPQVDEQDDHDGFKNGWKGQHPDSRQGFFGPLQHECHEYTRREQDHQVESGHRHVEFCMGSAALLRGEKGVEALQDPEQHS